MLHKEQKRRTHRDRITVLVAVPMILLMLWILPGCRRKAEGVALAFGETLVANIHHAPQSLRSWQPEHVSGWTPELISLLEQAPWAGTEVSVTVDRNDPFYRGKTGRPIILTLCHPTVAACIHIRMRGNFLGQACTIENFWRSHGDRCVPLSAGNQTRSETQ